MAHFITLEYYHLFQEILPLDFLNSTEISLILNIDGVPLFRSSKICVWPILGQFCELTENPFVIAIY